MYVIVPVPFTASPITILAKLLLAVLIKPNSTFDTFNVPVAPSPKPIVVLAVSGLIVIVPLPPLTAAPKSRESVTKVRE